MPAVSPQPGLMQVTSPVTTESLESLSSWGRIQFDGLNPDLRLNESDFRNINAFLERRPDVTFGVYHLGFDKDDNLEFLRFLPNMRRFSLDYSYRLADFEGLRFLPSELQTLGFGQTKKKLSLNFLGRFAGLRRLYLEGHKKDLRVVSNLTCLQVLWIRSLSLPDLEIFEPLSKLMALGIYLGGTSNLAALPNIGQIRHLDLAQIRGLTDLSPIADMPFLEYLLLQNLNRVEGLPSLKRLKHLKRVELTNVKGVTDLSPLLEAENLEEVAVYEARHLKPGAFDCLKEHRSLKRFSCATGSQRADLNAINMIGLPLAGDRPMFPQEDQDDCDGIG